MTEGGHFVRVPNNLRTLLFETGWGVGGGEPMEQNRLRPEAAKLAEVFQRSSSNVKGATVPLAAQPSTARTRPPQKASMPDRDLFS